MKTIEFEFNIGDSVIDFEGTQAVITELAYDKFGNKYRIAYEKGLIIIQSWRREKEIIADSGKVFIHKQQTSA